jgi:hypothetical protein
MSLVAVHSAGNLVKHAADAATLVTAAALRFAAGIPCGNADNRSFARAASAARDARNRRAATYRATVAGTESA